jgi:hypothetical protein
MSMRSLVLVSFAAAVASFASFASPARADVPTTTTTGSGTGGSASTGTSGGDTGCTVAVQSIDGTTCQLCGTGQSTSCGSLGSDYSYVCTQPSGTEIYCNGPNRNVPGDSNVASGCSISAPGLAVGGGAVAGFLALAAALSTRRRSRR